MGALPPVAGFLCAIAATGIATAVCAYSYRLASQLGVLDFPDNERKVHRAAVPMVGGIAILIAATFWLAFMLAIEGVSHHKLRLAMFICGIVAGLIGFVDDRQGMKPWTRMTLLFLLAFAALAIDPDLIATSARWAPLSSVALSPVMFCLLFSLSAAGVVNAVNMADGQNGIAGGMFLAWIGCLLFGGSQSISTAALMLLPLTVIFLIYNLREKIFLGDCGSYGVTFVLGLLVAAEYANGQITLATIVAWFFVPVADCLRLMATRLSSGRSLFAADREHLHHLMANLVGKRVTLASYLVIVTCASVVSTLRPNLADMCIAIESGCYCCMLLAARYRATVASTETLRSPVSIAPRGQIICESTSRIAP